MARCRRVQGLGEEAGRCAPSPRQSYRMLVVSMRGAGRYPSAADIKECVPSLTTAKTSGLLPPRLLAPTDFCAQ